MDVVVDGEVNDVEVLRRRQEVVGEFQIEYRRMWNLYFRDVPLFPGSAVDGVCRIAVPVGVAEHGRYGYLCDGFGNRKLVFCMRCLCGE